MIRLGLPGAGRPLERVLCVGAHCDDIEIGCSGAVLKLIAEHPETSVTWVVLGSSEVRAQEALESAHALLAPVRKKNIVIKAFRDGFFPYVGGDIKGYFEELKREVSPDLVFTHYRHDLHQDHRLISELTWNTFRDHLILEYEIPKYDGDLGTPNVFVPLDEDVCRRKIANILGSFRSQADKRWFTEDLFRAILRIRGMESNSPSGYAEAFYGRKVILG